MIGWLCRGRPQLRWYRCLTGRGGGDFLTVKEALTEWGSYILRQSAAELLWCNLSLKTWAGADTQNELRSQPGGKL